MNKAFHTHTHGVCCIFAWVFSNQSFKCQTGKIRADTAHVKWWMMVNVCQCGPVLQFARWNWHQPLDRGLWIHGWILTQFPAEQDQRFFSPISARKRGICTQGTVESDPTFESIELSGVRMGFTIDLLCFRNDSCVLRSSMFYLRHRSVPIRTHTVQVKAKGGILGPTFRICQKIGWKRWNSGATLLWFATWDANMSAKSQSPERVEQLHVLMRRASNRKDITVLSKGYEMQWCVLCDSMRLRLGRQRA